MAVTSPQVRLWTCEEYYRMAEAGILAPEERVELIEGQIVRTPSQSPPHAAMVGVACEALRGVLCPGSHPRGRLPLTFGPYSEPEPDVAVVRGAPRDYVEAHPSAALLVVEVADTTLDFDRGRKAGLYARAGIPEYWIVNLPDRVLEVHTDPGPLPDRPAEHGYRSTRRIGPPDSIAPLFSPAAHVRVADLLP